jgi:hypothetical protein
MNRPHPTSLAAGAVIALTPLAPAGAALAATSPSRTTARSTTIVDCTGHAVFAPRDYVLACGDGDTALTRLRWRDWGEERATATATAELNLCSPDCVEGKVARFPVTVDAERLRGGHYRELVVHAGSGRPKGVHAIERWYPIRPGQ